MVAPTSPRLSLQPEKEIRRTKRRTDGQTRANVNAPTRLIEWGHTNANFVNVVENSQFN